MPSKKLIGMIALGAVFCLLSGAPSFAAVVNPGDTISFSSAPGRDTTFAGGAFTITDATSGSSWYTFCLEYNEYISFGTGYKVDSVGPAAVKGGVGGGNPDFISSQTAYLYYLYATGGIVGENTGAVSGAGTGDQQKALQNVFWYLENEIGTLPSNVYTQDYLKIAQQATNGQYYGVLVVNPILGTTAAQSQLVYVPEAGSFLLLGSGLIGLIGYRRKRRMK